VNITAVPDGNHNTLLDCDECGPLGVVERSSVGHAVAAHLIDHGIEPPLTNTCECGYDYARITGHNLDHATCNDCGWESYGMFADHQAVHHFIVTHHTWSLLMGDKTW
jgi:hypothetical protein